MQTNKRKLLSVKEAAETLINSELTNTDKNDIKYKTELRKATQKIYKGIRKHQFDIFGDSKILLNQKQVDDFKSGKITAKSIYSPFGNITLDFDESVKFIESFHNPNSIKDPLKYKSKCQYVVTNKGRVFDLTYRRELSQVPAAHGYLQSSIRVKGKKLCERVHILVAFTWCPNGKLKDVVHHIDGNINNNKATNLIWMTRGLYQNIESRCF